MCIFVSAGFFVDPYSLSPENITRLFVARKQNQCCPHCQRTSTVYKDHLKNYDDGSCSFNKILFFCPQVRILTTFFLPLFLEFFERKTSKSLLIGLQEQLLKIAAAFFFVVVTWK